MDDEVIRNFNSIKVRLKRVNSLHYDSESKRNFNSIKVRLKLVKQIKLGVDMLFQFHKGTIKTILELTDDVA